MQNLFLRHSQLSGQFAISKFYDCLVLISRLVTSAWYLSIILTPAHGTLSPLPPLLKLRKALGFLQVNKPGGGT